MKLYRTIMLAIMPMALATTVSATDYQVDPLMLRNLLCSIVSTTIRRAIQPTMH